MLIDFLIPENQYGTVKYFTESLIRSMQKLGVEARNHYIGQFFSQETIDILARSPPDWTFSFSNIYGGEWSSFANVFKLHHHTYLLDPVIYSLHHVVGEYTSLSCIDEGDCAFVKQFGFNNVTTLFHGIDAEYFLPPLPRSYEAVFFGSFYPLNKLDEFHQEIANRVLTSDISILQAIIEAGVKEEDVVWSFKQIDRYTRLKERMELISRFPNITIWGEGNWRKHFPHAKVHRPISFPKVLDVMRRSKYVLSNSARFKRGYHERIFAALASSALVVTAENPLLKGLEGIITYPHGQWEAIPDLLSTPTSLEAGRERVLKEHTWDQRAVELLKHLQSGHWDTSRVQRAK